MCSASSIVVYCVAVLRLCKSQATDVRCLKVLQVCVRVCTCVCVCACVYPDYVDTHTFYADHVMLTVILRTLRQSFPCQLLFQCWGPCNIRPTPPHTDTFLPKSLWWTQALFRIMRALEKAGHTATTLQAMIRASFVLRMFAKKTLMSCKCSLYHFAMQTTQWVQGDCSVQRLACGKNCCCFGSFVHSSVVFFP
jgi:hypothetical protein